MTLVDTSAGIEFLRRAGGGDVKARVAALLELGRAAYLRARGLRAESGSEAVGAG